MVAAVAALAFGLAACGSSSDDDTADAPTGTTPTTPTTPPAASPVAASGDVMGAALQAAFSGVLGKAGDSDTVEIAAGDDSGPSGRDLLLRQRLSLHRDRHQQPRNHRRDVDELHAR